jgi:hypothetical protein
MAHTLLYLLGYNAPESAILPAGWDWSKPATLDAALAKLTKALRPWTIDFHVAQNDASVKGSGTHDKTGRHCQPDDPNGKLKIAHHAGFWLRDAKGRLTKSIRHICWDGCMFPNDVMLKQDTWNSILAAMISVRDAHGWSEPAASSRPISSITVRTSRANKQNKPKQTRKARHTKTKTMSAKAKAKAKTAKAKTAKKKAAKKK